MLDLHFQTKNNEKFLMKILKNPQNSGHPIPQPKFHFIFTFFIFYIFIFLSKDQKNF